MVTILAHNDRYATAFIDSIENPTCKDSFDKENCARRPGIHSIRTISKLIGGDRTLIGN